MRSSFKILLASLAAGVAAQGAKIVVGTQGELDTFIAVLTQLVVAGTAAMAVFALVSYYLNIPEFFQFIRSIQGRIFKVKKVIGEDTAEVSGI